MLHAFESNVPIFEMTDRGLREAMDSGGIGIRNQFFEYLDLARNPSPEHRRHVVDLLGLRYGQRSIDMMITLYNEALQILLNEGRTIFPGIPILALYVPHGFEPPRTDRRIIHQLTRIDVKGTMQIALRLMPRMKRVYVVSGTNPADRSLENRVREDGREWESRLEFRYLSDLPMKEILATVAGASPESIVLLLGFASDVTGKSYTTREVGNRLGEVSRAPVFGVFDISLGYGIAGGSLFSFEHVGKRAGELAVGILGQTKIGEDIPSLLDVPTVPMFDWRQLRRWNLSESALPKGSIVINRETTLWDFRYHIFGGLAFILIQALMISGLLLSRRREKAAKDSLLRKTEELDQFFSLTLDLLCVADTHGYFLRLNPAWEKALGYSLEELEGKLFYDFVHPEDLVSTREAVSSLLSQNKLVHFENRYRRKDGSYCRLEWMAAPAGTLIYATARDLTERLKAEAEAQERRDELAHVSRIATMGELTASLAHEINQPLTAIRSNAEAAQRYLSHDSPDIREIRQILEDIIQDNRRAGEVVREVRALVKKEKPCRVIVDLNGAIREVFGLIRGDSILRGLSLVVELRPGLQTVLGDPAQLQQVILNLILNSAAALRDSLGAERKIIVKTERRGTESVRVAVTDFGDGIDESNIERLFEPFYTTRPEGLGMGLSISRRIIGEHGGEMEVFNNPEGGCTFAFILPAHDGDRR